MKLTDEEAIDKVNPFVQHEMSLPGTVRQSGDYNDFEKRKGVVVLNTPKFSMLGCVILLVFTMILLRYSSKR